MSQTYTIKKGDTVYGISNQFGVSALDLSNLNHLAGTKIYEGQVLIIPEKEGNNPSSLFTYTVEKGDTLYNIAKRYNTTVADIVGLNYLKTNDLTIGQKLQIPESGESVTTLPSFTNYIVKKGDNLYSIAKAYKLTIDQILQDNNLKNNILTIGQILKIRVNPQNQSVIEECYGEAYVPTENINYTVVQGDSLYNIAKRYNTTVDNIKNKNNLTSNVLTIGQKLKI